MKVKKISVVGLGKLGLCMATVFASKGFKIIGVETDKNKIKMINQGRNPIIETGLTELIKRNHNNLKAGNDYRQAILETEVNFVVVATPSEKDGTISNKQIEESLRNIAIVLKEKRVII